MKQLSKKQSGLRPERNTADAVWTHRWLAAKALKEETTIKISVIDMSAVFDTIDRRQIQIQFLLSGTVIDTRINGTSTSKPFTSNVGTAQETCSQRSPTYTAEPNNLT